MPFGSISFFGDEEWANGVTPGSGWETFVARDVVQAIDSRYRTIPTGEGRAIAGLSEGGYGALNIGLHHPGEFGLIESWSGYMWADRIPRVFGSDPAVLAFNSPAVTIWSEASVLRRDHTFIWFYCGTRDGVLNQNRAFSAELAALHIAHTFFAGTGRHSWALWRRYMPQALIAASEHVVHA